ncbi:MAG TPA: NAD(P)/FAD-dependent oxidoreductase [Solirubrobacteraceae bacterium]
MAPHIVIVGGGFGGFSAARTLERTLPAQSASVTLVNDANFMLYTPLLPGAAGATLDPRHVVVPLRSALRRTELLVGRVDSGDPQQRTITVKRVDGEQVTVSYDRLLVALGSVSRTLPIPGLAEHAIGFKSLADATALRNRILTCLDIAETLEDPEERAPYLSFVFVGAGYAGVEGLAELQDLAAQAIELYPRCRLQGMRWVLVEARDRIMQEVPVALSEFAAAELRSRGIEVRLGTMLNEARADAVVLSDGETVPARTIVWTAGVKPSPVVARLGLPLSSEGRIVVDATMQVAEHERVWAIGDCAAVPDPAAKGDARGRPCPPTAQHAIRQGRVVAGNVASSLADGKARRFRYRTMGVVAELGHNNAVAITLGIRWRGLPAWLVARTYHLLLMPGFGRKLRLLVDWNVALVFGRDASAPGQLGTPAPLEVD